MKLIRKVLIFSVLFCAVSVSLFYIVKPHKRVVLSSEDSKQLWGNCYLTTRVISVPGFPKAYNPSLIQYKDGYLLSFRVDSYDLKSSVKHLLNHRVSYLGIARLDKQFKAFGKPQLLDINYSDPKKISAPQDARLYTIEDKIYLLFNDYAKPLKGSQEMFIGELVDKGIFVLNDEPKLLHYAESKQRVEKNWSPFTYEDKFYVVYKIKPHTILEVDLNTGSCEKVVETDKDWNWNFGENRGGTPCCQIGDEYLSFFHSSKRGVPTFFRKGGGRVFYMGAYTFENKPPFSIKKISHAPIGRLEDYEFDNREKIVYPTGLIVEGDQIHVAWGKNDRQICISTLDKNKLMSSLKECP